MIRTYEGMFLLDAGNADFQAASAPIREVLDHAEAQVLSLKPWDERRLAYEIKGRRRGLYVLSYFKAEPSRLSELEHEIQLSEKILRALVLSADHVSQEKIDAETPGTLAAAKRTAETKRAAQKAAKAEQAKEKHAEEGGQGKAEKPAAEPPPPAEPTQQPQETPEPGKSPRAEDREKPTT